MRKSSIVLILCLLGEYLLVANPAYPGKIAYRQPDGSIVYVRMHGDEWYHYTTDEKGRVVELSESGFLVETEKPSREMYEQAVARRRAAGAARAWSPHTDMTMGVRHIPVFLIQFQDKKFIESDPKTSFSNLLNLPGYSYNGATGSVRDYYYDNSGGKFTPIFDVYGPYTLSGNVADYGGSNYSTGACRALFDTCVALDDEVDFSQYDVNNDGKVDMILFYFAGYNQADGGRVYNKETIWPHQYWVPYGYSAANSTTFDGKKLDRYFCTSEFQGYSGSRLAGIGTTCHEFGHSLGLPDFYDTDYEDNGESGGLYQYSIMCSGSRLNNENTPPYFNTIEKQMLGWAGEPESLTSTGQYEIQSVNTGGAYILPSAYNDEYFLLECRIKSGWDAYLPSGGLLVFHIDKKASTSVTFTSNGRNYTRTAKQLWDNWETFNAINLVGDHPLFYLLPAAEPTSLNYGGSQANIPFPGSSRVTSLVPLDWAGNENEMMISSIAYTGEKVSFILRYTTTPGVYGKIMNTSAKPIKGATISVYKVASTSGANVGKLARSIHRARGSLVQSMVTDLDGTYVLELDGYQPGEYEMEVSCSGYETYVTTLSLGAKKIEYNVYLNKVGETVSEDLKRYSGSGSYYGYGYSSVGIDQAASIHFSKDEMGAYKGKQILSISFACRKSGSDGSSTVNATGDLYVFVEMGGERLFTQKVENPVFGSFNTVNIVNQRVVIDNPSETYVGYGILNSNISSPLLIEVVDQENMGFLGRFSTTSATSWSGMSGSSEYYTPLISASVGEPVAPDMGFNYIANPGNGVYKAGERFALEVVETEYDTPQSVTWYYDGVLTQASSVSLTAGSHQIEARLGFSDGTTERIYLTIQVQ